MGTVSAATPTSVASFARHAAWALLAGIYPDDGDYGEWQGHIAMLRQALDDGGQSQVAREFDILCSVNTDFAAIMAEDPPLQRARQIAVQPPAAKPVHNSMLVDPRADDEGNAQAAYALFGDCFLYCGAYGYLMWCGTHWSVEGAEASLQRAIVYTLNERRHAAAMHDIESIVKYCQGTAKRVRDCEFLFRSMVTVPVETFDQSPRLLNVKNGVLDLATGHLTPHDPSQRFTYCVSVPYDPNADMQLWLRFLSDVVGGGQDVIDYLQRAVGYSLTGHVQEENLFYIYGPTRSGKGTFQETLLKLMMPPLGIEVDFNSFTATREHDAQNFDLAGLKPARLIFSSESNKYQTLNAAKVKGLTGGDIVRCAFKHRDLFEYKPQYKMWLLSNQPVNGDVDDDALWGRVRVIEFPNSFLGQEDKLLKRRLQEPEHLTGVLAWAARGAILWFSSPRGLQAPESVTIATKKQRTELDYVQAWIDECCQYDPTNFEQSSDLYQSYRLWCKDSGTKEKSARGLGMVLTAKGFVADRRTLTGHRTVRGFVGLSIIP